VHRNPVALVSVYKVTMLLPRQLWYQAGPHLCFVDIVDKVDFSARALQEHGVQFAALG
jgi:hypothetical protein